MKDLENAIRVSNLELINHIIAKGYELGESLSNDWDIDQATLLKIKEEINEPSIDPYVTIDAKLISAAPDLLEAALDFVNKVETGRAKSTDSYNKFKVAIAKATNED